MGRAAPRKFGGGRRLRPGLPVIATALFLALFAGDLHGATRAGLFNPRQFTLDNGLQVVVISDHRAPVVTHMIWYKVGAADDPPGRTPTH